MSDVSADPQGGSGAVTVVTVVHAPACHFCDDAETVLTQLADVFDLELDRIAIGSERGQELMRLHRAPMSPLVLVDGVFFSSGRLPRRKLLELLLARSAARPKAGAARGTGA